MNSYQHSRKSFIGKLIGLGIGAGILPTLAAATRREPARVTETADTGKKPFKIRNDPRSISRTDMS